MPERLPERSGMNPILIRGFDDVLMLRKPRNLYRSCSKSFSFLKKEGRSGGFQKNSKTVADHSDNDMVHSVI
jgi:hypothetical protein